MIQIKLYKLHISDKPVTFELETVNVICHYIKNSKIKILKANPSYLTFKCWFYGAPHSFDNGYFMWCYILHSTGFRIQRLRIIKPIYNPGLSK